MQKIKNNESLKRCIVRYLHSADHHPARTKNNDEILPD